MGWEDIFGWSSPGPKEEERKRSSDELRVEWPEASEKKLAGPNLEGMKGSAERKGKRGHQRGQFGPSEVQAR